MGITVSFSMINKQPDFIAQLKYLTTKEDGRKTAAFSGYRPQIKFAFSELQTIGQQIFLDKDVANPGDEITAEIAILSVDFFKNKLNESLDFEFREGSRVIGTGKILKILNSVLTDTNL